MIMYMFMIAFCEKKALSQTGMKLHVDDLYVLLQHLHTFTRTFSGGLSESW